jgi:hypothetical protein
MTGETCEEHTAYEGTAFEELIVLTSNEKVDIIAFLLTLTDKSFIFNA